MKTWIGPLALVAALCVAGATAAQEAANATAAPACPVLISAPSESLRPTPPVRPEMPSCIDPKTRIGHCRHGELQRYNTAVDTYNDSMNAYNKAAGDYVDALNRFVQSAGAYSHCQIEILNAATRKASSPSQ